MRKTHPLLLNLLCLALATALWLPTVHVFFAPSQAEALTAAPDERISPMAQALLERQLAVIERSQSSSEDLALLRHNNPEWDFMGRTFTVLALANLALRASEERPRYLAAMDRLIEETLELEAEHGPEYFLMSYWRHAPFVAQPARTLFVEGEIALMLGARQLIEERPEYAPLLRSRINSVIEHLSQGPMLSGESYPDECWTFCNAVALAAIRIADMIHGEDHSELSARWLENARTFLVDPRTGMLVSEFTYEGVHLDGPEGSSIFFVAHFLQLVDEDFARDQYRRARQALGVEVAGFAYAREWPDSSRAIPDIDSGPIIPITGASAGASGMAILGAAAFEDRSFLRGLITSLEFAGFPIEDSRELRYGASNQVGDAVLLYALVQGPLWAHVINGGRG